MLIIMISLHNAMTAVLTPPGGSLQIVMKIPTTQKKISINPVDFCTLVFPLEPHWYHCTNRTTSVARREAKNPLYEANKSKKTPSTDRIKEIR